MDLMPAGHLDRELLRSMRSGAASLVWIPVLFSAVEMLAGQVDVIVEYHEEQCAKNIALEDENKRLRVVLNNLVGDRYCGRCRGLPKCPLCEAKRI